MRVTPVHKNQELYKVRIESRREGLRVAKAVDTDRRTKLRFAAKVIFHRPCKVVSFHADAEELVHINEHIVPPDLNLSRRLGELSILPEVDSIPQPLETALEPQPAM